MMPAQLWTRHHGSATQSSSRSLSVGWCERCWRLGHEVISSKQLCHSNSRTKARHRVPVSQSGALFLLLVNHSLAFVRGPELTARSLLCMLECTCCESVSERRLSVAITA